MSILQKTEGKHKAMTHSICYSQVQNWMRYLFRHIQLIAAASSTIWASLKSIQKGKWLTYYRIIINAHSRKTIANHKVYSLYKDQTNTRTISWKGSFSRTFSSNYKSMMLFLTFSIQYFLLWWCLGQLHQLFHRVVTIFHQYRYQVTLPTKF